MTDRRKTFEVIPAMDIIGGSCVRLTRGDYAQKKIYNADPVDMAKTFADAGFSRLHMVDLDGAKAGYICNLEVLEAVAAANLLTIDFGGGIKNLEDMNRVFNAGASIITLGSVAVREPAMVEEWLLEFGGEKILIGADVLDDKIRISGWLEDGGISLSAFIGKMMAAGAQQIFCTDISKDGAMQGPAVELYKKILEQYPAIHLIASGGVTSLGDVEQLMAAGCSGVIIGKAIYEGNIRLSDLAKLNGN